MASIANGESGASVRAKLNTVLARDVYGGVLQSNYALTSQTGAQRLFNWSANGALTLPTGIYQLDALLMLTGMSATSGNGQFSLAAGTATLARILYQSTGMDANAVTTAAGITGAITQQRAIGGVPTVSASTGTQMMARLHGMFDVTVEGTIIPSIALTTAAAAVVQQGSYFVCTRMAPTGTATFGDAWS